MFPSILSEEYRTRFEKDYDWDEFYDDSINRQSVWKKRVMLQKTIRTT
jgi:hypothetical protein